MLELARLYLDPELDVVVGGELGVLGAHELRVRVVLLARGGQHRQLAVPEEAQVAQRRGARRRRRRRGLARPARATPRCLVVRQQRKDVRRQVLLWILTHDGLRRLAIAIIAIGEMG